MVFPIHSLFILGLVFGLNQTSFLASGFFVHMRHFETDFLFFLNYFNLIF